MKPKVKRRDCVTLIKLLSDTRMACGICFACRKKGGRKMAFLCFLSLPTFINTDRFTSNDTSMYISARNKG